MSPTKQHQKETRKPYTNKHKVPGFWSWQTMIRRCYKTDDPSYKNYGARGVDVCERWLQDYHNFYLDMGERPHRTTLDRINNELGYSPINCKWSTWTEQNNNKRKPSGSVYFYKPRNKWRSRITKNGKRISCGYFDTKEEAYIAIKQAIAMD